MAIDGRISLATVGRYGDMQLRFARVMRGYGNVPKRFSRSGVRRWLTKAVRFVEDHETAVFMRPYHEYEQRAAREWEALPPLARLFFQRSDGPYPHNPFPPEIKCLFMVTRG